MNYIKRGIITIKRKPGKTMILLALLFILGNIISGAISVRQGIHQTEANIRALLPPLAFIRIDWENYRSPWENDEESLLLDRMNLPQKERLNLDVVSQIGRLPYVRAYDFSLGTFITGREMIRYYNFRTNSGDTYIVISDDPEAANGSFGNNGFNHIDLRGVQNINMVDIQEELISLYSGRLFTQKELDNGESVGMVSRGFAEVNNLQIGSSFTLEHVIFDFGNRTGREAREMGYEAFIHRNLTKEIVITGIFEVERGFDHIQNPSEADWIEGKFQNRIYLPNSKVEEFIKFDFEAQEEVRPGFFGNMPVDDLGMFSIFALDDPRNLGAFANAANELLPNGWTINFVSNNFQKMTASMDSIMWIFDIVLWAAVFSTIIIVSLLMTLFLRDRKHEMGILLALGEKKGKIVSQILLEVLSVSIIAMTLSVFSGNMISSGISRQMLENQLIQQQAEAFENGLTNAIPPEYDLGDIPIEEMLAIHDTSLNEIAIILFFTVGLVTILISTILPLIYVLRMNPKEILL